MPSCEKCWSDSATERNFGPSRDVEDEGPYQRLVRERDAAGEGCTPEQQAGPDAAVCPRCQRKTVHQHAKVCTAPNCLWDSLDGPR